MSWFKNESKYVFLKLVVREFIIFELKSPESCTEGMVFKEWCEKQTSKPI